MNIKGILEDIDKTTGDVNACLELIERYKYTLPDLYHQYKQYWMLVYIAGMDLDTFSHCMSIPESQRLQTLSHLYPKSLKHFSPSTLQKLLKQSDESLLPLFPYLWDKLPKQTLIERILNSQNPELFLNLNIKIDTLPELNTFSCSTLKTLMALASPNLLPDIIHEYYSKHSQEFLTRFIDSKKLTGFEKSITIDNFRVIKALMKAEDLPVSPVFLNLLQSILSGFMAPPVLSAKLLPFEIPEILQELSSEDLNKLKKFVFTKMVAFNTRSQIAALLEDRGVKCEAELRLQKLKEPVLNQMDEESALELLASQSYVASEDLVLAWRRQKVFNNLVT